MSIPLTFAAIAALAGLGLRPKGPRKTTGSPNKDRPEWMDRLPTVPQDRKITRTGFPWPTDTPIYHATTALQAILRQGFRTREEGTKSALGGRHLRSISTTLSHRHAASIALGLDTLRRVAQKEISLVNLINQLNNEVEISDIYLYGIDGLSGVKSYEEALSVLKIYDNGYMSFSIPKDEEIKIPSGAIEIYETEHWTYGFVKESGEYENIKYKSNKNDVGFSLYKTSLYIGKNKQKCFDPLFVGTNMSAIEELSEKDIGVIRGKANISRVSTDDRGAMRLGYIKQRIGTDLLNELYRNAEDSLDSHSSESKERSMNRTLFTSWLGGYGYESDYKRPFPNRYAEMEGDVPKEKDQWIIRQQGERVPSDTMLYYDSETEMRIFDTSKISIESTESVSDIRRMYKLKNRITFPYFDGRNEDLRVWPVGIKRNSK